MVKFGTLSQLDEALEERERSSAVLEPTYEKEASVSASIVHIGLSSDEITLSVVTSDGNSLNLLCFDVRSCASQVSSFCILLFSVFTPEV